MANGTPALVPLPRAPEGRASLAGHASVPFRHVDAHALGETTAGGSLLAVDGARLWFSLYEQVTDASLYTYQVPATGYAGASKRALDTEFVEFSSYSYLGLNGHPRIVEASHAALGQYGTSSGGVRMLTGTTALHLQLEQELAHVLGQQAAATFASGFDANVGVVTALFGSEDHVLLDKYAHRSLADAVRLAGCQQQRFRHNDLDHLESLLQDLRSHHAGRILVIVDGLFSMDGDEAPLAGLIELKQRYEAFLLVDEAHALGVLGAHGRGTWESQGVNPHDIDIITGSLGKALPSSGGYVAGSSALTLYMQHGSSPYFFSGALSPVNTASALAALQVLQDEPQHLARLEANTAKLIDTLVSLDLPVTGATSAIVPLILGDEWRTWRWARTLHEAGVAASAVPYPAVALGSSRLRLCATATHTDADFERLAAGLMQCKASELSAVH